MKVKQQTDPGLLRQQQIAKAERADAIRESVTTATDRLRRLYGSRSTSGRPGILMGLPAPGTPSRAVPFAVPGSEP